MELSVDWDADDLAEFLTEKGLHDEVISNVIDNRITSALFLELTEADLKELAPAIGDRLALRKVLEQAKKVNYRHLCSVDLHYYYRVQNKQIQNRQMVEREVLMKSVVGLYKNSMVTLTLLKLPLLGILLQAHQDGIQSSRFQICRPFHTMFRML